MASWTTAKPVITQFHHSTHYFFYFRHISPSEHYS